MTTITQEGRRYYLDGLPFGQKDRAKSRGCKWDGARRAWWTGKRDVAEQVASAVNAAPKSEPTNERPAREAPGEHAVVAGRASYKGRSYYLAGREHGRTRWDLTVDAITSRDGARVLLYFRDGSSQFWADRSAVTITKTYGKPQTIGGLRRFAEERKTHGTEECRCHCHREHNAGAPGSILYDGCDRCGCEAC